MDTAQNLEGPLHRMPAFSFFLRTGRRLPEDLEQKFNPWHDPDDGRFTFAGQGRHFGGGHASAQPTRSATTRANIQIRTTKPNPRGPAKPRPAKQPVSPNGPNPLAVMVRSSNSRQPGPNQD